MTPAVLARLAVSAGLLGLVVWVLDGALLVERLSALQPAWVLVALALSVPQVALSAYRWCRTASRLGVDLSFRDALREYYLAIFLNQVLPGGVTGDVSRAWLHARAGKKGASPAPPDQVLEGDPPPAGERRNRTRVGPEARAVILERASGQVMMGAAVALSLLVLPLAAPTARTWLLGAAGLLGGALALGLILWNRRHHHGALGSAWRDIHKALLAPDIVRVQIVTSALVIGSYVLMYVAAARAVGVTMPVLALAPLVPPVLMSMVIPATVAGWGVREATAAGVWTAVGLAPEDGVVISAAYGVLVLLSTLPGAWVLMRGTGRRVLEA